MNAIINHKVSPSPSPVSVEICERLIEGGLLDWFKEWTGGAEIKHLHPMERMVVAQGGWNGFWFAEDVSIVGREDDTPAILEEMKEKLSRANWLRSEPVYTRQQFTAAA